MRRNALILGLVFLFPVIILSALYSFRRSSLQRSAAEPAIFAAQSSPTMVALIGVPMQPGWPIHGTMSTRRGSGTANLEIPLAGPNGKGILLEWAEQRQGRWHVCSVIFRSQAGPEILLAANSPGNCGK